MKPSIAQRILPVNCLHEILDRHLGFSIRGVERKFLPRRFAGCADAAVLRRTIFKAPQKITHWSKLRDCADTLEYFLKVAGGLGERLGPVLFQLPPTFKKDADVLNSFLRELPDMRTAFEFRHESWFDDEIFNLLQSRNIALCIADTGALSTPTKITADYGYLRLRREDYTDTDVKRWSDFVREQGSNWKDAFVYFKHEESGIGPKLARQMTELLG